MKSLSPLWKDTRMAQNLPSRLDMEKDRDFTENEIYEKLLSDKLSVNLGYLYENVVACLLAANGNSLFYHTMMNEN